ncbi:MAG: DNA gyrase modulator, partial [Acidimicrobiales bacterium]
MSVEDLLALGDRIVGRAEGDEQVEAVVVRGRDTEIRVYEGEIEQLSSAEAMGVGVRVIRDHRQGFAYAGTLDADVLAETLAEARDNAGFGTVDEALGLAEPDGVAVPDLDLFREALADVPTEQKVELAMALERAARAADPRITGIESADYADSMSEAAVVTSTGIRTASAETGCFVTASVLATEGDEVQDGFWFSVGRDPSEIDIDV